MATNVSGAGSVSGAGTSGLLASSNRFILGITYPINDPSTGRPKLGGGMQGYIPPFVVDSDMTYEQYEQLRLETREAWNTNYQAQLLKAGKKRVITPFRAVNNAGDVLGREYTYYVCGGTPQTSNGRSGLRGLKNAFGTIHSVCDRTGVPAATCNGRYVYDGSDYVRYKKQLAVNNNYNNLSNGGDNFSGAQSAIRAVRRGF